MILSCTVSICFFVTLWILLPNYLNVLMKDEGFWIILLTPYQPSFSSSVPEGFKIIIVIPRAATWWGGLFRALKAVNYLASTTFNAFSAYATWGLAYFKIYSAYFCLISIYALYLFNYFSFSTAFVWFCSTFALVTLISYKIASTSIFSALTYFCLTYKSCLRIETDYLAYLSFDRPLL